MHTSIVRIATQCKINDNYIATTTGNVSDYTQFTAMHTSTNTLQNPLLIYTRLNRTGGTISINILQNPLLTQGSVEQVEHTSINTQQNPLLTNTRLSRTGGTHIHQRTFINTLQNLLVTQGSVEQVGQYPPLYIPAQKYDSILVTFYLLFR